MRRRRFLTSAASTAAALTAAGTAAGRRRPPTVVTEFDVVGKSSASPTSEYEISVGPDRRVVEVTGTVVGSNTCASARLADVAFDGETLEVAVESHDPTDPMTLCGMAITGVEYEARFVASEAVEDVSVDHRGVGESSGRRPGGGIALR